MKIGSIKLSSNPILALSPMAGYTNIALRQLMVDTGADISYSELASATAISREKSQSGSTKTDSIIKTHKNKISAVQLFGADEKEISFAIKHVCNQVQSGLSYAKFIDINLGCPAPKVTKTGSGSQLLYNPKKLRNIAKSALKHSSLPMTAKLRLLPNLEDTINVAKLLQEQNFSALAFHGRTQKQKYSGHSNWSAIAKIKQELDIPIIVNGDIKTAQDVKKSLEISACDAAMIGRAALSNPLFFEQSKKFFKNIPYKKTTLKDKIEFLKKYIHLSKKYNCNFIYQKELAMQFASGFRGAASLRQKISKSKDSSTLISYFEMLQ